MNIRVKNLVLIKSYRHILQESFQPLPQVATVSVSKYILYTAVQVFGSHATLDMPDWL
jgi:hypothetical protein